MAELVMRQGIRWSGILVLLAFVAGAVFLVPRIYEKFVGVKDPLHEAALALEEAGAGHVDIVNIELTERAVLIYVLVVQPFESVQSPEWLRYDAAVAATYEELRNGRPTGALLVLASYKDGTYVTGVFTIDLDCVVAAHGFADECYSYQRASVVVPEDKLLMLGVGA